MLVVGLKKQFYKVSQLVSEKVGGVEGIKLDDDFKEMEKKVDVISKVVIEVLVRIIEYLQFNLVLWVKLIMFNMVFKIWGQVKNFGYLQLEGFLGECMICYGKELGGEFNFGDVLLDVGEFMKCLVEVKDFLDIEVKQNFIDFFQNLCEKDLKEIQYYLKKLEGCCLDFDYKKKWQGKIFDEELCQVLEKFEEFKEVVEISMYNFLEIDIEQVSQFLVLVDVQLDYYWQVVQILDELVEKFKCRMWEVFLCFKWEYKFKFWEFFDFGEFEQFNGGFFCIIVFKIVVLLFF